MYFIYYNNMATNITCRLLCVLSKLSFAILFPNPFGVGFGYEQKCRCWLSLRPQGQGSSYEQSCQMQAMPCPQQLWPLSHSRET